ncbi:hypothetical protein, partial [Cupriavidus necator]
ISTISRPASSAQAVASASCGRVSTSPVSNKNKKKQKKQILEYFHSFLLLYYNLITDTHCRSPAPARCWPVC